MYMHKHNGGKNMQVVHECRVGIQTVAQTTKHERNECFVELQKCTNWMLLIGVTPARWMLFVDVTPARWPAWQKH
jgi:hypothetical protein